MRWIILIAFIVMACNLAWAQETCVSPGNPNSPPQYECKNTPRKHFHRCNFHFLDDANFNYRYPENIWSAAKLGHDWLVDWNLTQNPQLLNQTDNLGWTPLHYAAYGGHRTTIELLLLNGADASIKNPKGQTALDIIRKQGYFWTADLLKKAAKK